MKPDRARSIEELKVSVRKGARPKYLFFWGHTPKVPGRLDQSCLSNWFPARFEVDGTAYPTTEHFMMAEKARLFGDKKILAKILSAGSPGGAKRFGREVAGFNELAWAEARFEIVTVGNLQKFSQNPEMGDLLRATGTKVLVEASPRDRIWGIGMGKNHEHAENPDLWKGLNLLGFSLMEARERLLSGG